MKDKKPFDSSDWSVGLVFVVASTGIIALAEIGIHPLVAVMMVGCFYAMYKVGDWGDKNLR